MLWLGFILLVAAGLIIFGIVVHYKSSFYIKMLDSLQEKNQQQLKSVKTLQRRIAIIKTQGKLQQEVNETNNVLKESIQNMFDLIPDQITLSKVVMEKESLYLKGYTTSQDSYNLLLEPALKSIFTHTKVKFSRDAQGRIIFESFSTIKDALLEDIDEGQ